MGTDNKLDREYVNPAYSVLKFVIRDEIIATSCITIISGLYQFPMTKNWYSPSKILVFRWWTLIYPNWCCVVIEETRLHALGGLDLKLTQSLMLVATAGWEAFNLHLKQKFFDRSCLQTLGIGICTRLLNRCFPERHMRSQGKMRINEANKVLHRLICNFSSELRCAIQGHRQLEQGSEQPISVRLFMFSGSGAATLLSDMSDRSRDRVLYSMRVSVRKPAEYLAQGTKFRDGDISHMSKMSICLMQTFNHNNVASLKTAFREPVAVMALEASKEGERLFYKSRVLKEFFGGGCYIVRN